MKKIWEVLKKNYDIFLTMIGAGAVYLYGFISKPIQSNVLNAILVVLALIAINLLRNRLRDDSLQQKMDRIIENLSDPSASQIFLPYSDQRNKIAKRLWQAKEVWVFSRTCAGFWAEYDEQLDNLLAFNNESIIKIISVDPSNGAVKMIEKYTEFKHQNEAKLVKTNIEAFLKDKKELSDKYPGKIYIHVIDYLPPWSLTLIDPNTKEGIIYVELATFAANSGNRPTFSLKYENDKMLYNKFRKDFEDILKEAIEFKYIGKII